LLNTTTHVIAEKVDFKVKSLIEKYDMNIVRSKWIKACSERGILLELEPAYMIHTNTQLESYFRNCLD
jgi:hypothetical protein